jgi:hypothetical protein
MAIADRERRGRRLRRRAASPREALPESSLANAPPKPLTKAQLKEVARTIILSQGNKFVRELLRKHKITMGLNKADFLRHMAKAIDDGLLTQPMIDEWLAAVEGWGNQHVYLYAPPDVAPADLEALFKASAHAGLLASPISYDFPDELLLTGISLDGKSLSLVWHLGDSGWERAKNKDFTREEDGETYRYDAYRERADRSVVRFDWHFGDPYCAIFIQLPNSGDLHSAAIAKVFDDIAAVGLIGGPPDRLSLTEAVKKSSQDRKVVVQSTKMGAPGGYVELAATVEGGIDKIQAIREARKAVDDSLFSSADGMFGLPADDQSGLSIAVKAQVYGAESRIRIWVQCTREDVYRVIRYFWSKNR